MSTLSRHPLKTTCLLSIACALASIATSCNDDSPSDDDEEETPAVFDRRALLSGLGAEVFIPTYEAFAAASVQLEADAAALCGWATVPEQMLPTALLSAPRRDRARAQWVETYQRWKRSEVSSFGPHSALPKLLGRRLDSWPIREEAMESFLRSAATLDVAALEAQGSALRGLPNLEYLLFFEGTATDAEDSTADEDEGDPLAEARRCRYLAALATEIRRRGQDLVAAWSSDQGNYLAQLVTAGEGSTEFASLHDAVSEVFNRMIFAVENVREIKLGKPLGLRSGGELRLDDLEARFSNASKETALATLAGARQVYLGAIDTEQELRESPALGFQDYLLARGEAGGAAGAGAAKELDRDIMAAFDDAKAAILAISGTLREAILDRPAVVNTAYEKVAELQRILSVDLAGQLAITVTFNDTDGD